MDTNNKISNLVQSTVPFFVRNDHQNFVRFVEAYYEWLEQPDSSNTKQYNVVTRAKNVRSFNDIDDTSVDAFTDELYKTFLKLIPEDTAADKAIILKNAKDFYRARGTEKSIRFLMRVLFDDQETDFYYPKKDVLRASDGKWFIEKSIKFSDVLVNGNVSTSTADVRRLVGQTVTGSQSGATAAVERVDFYYEGGTEIRELKISNQTKDFVSGEQVVAQVNGDTIAANTFSGILNTVTLRNPGTLYQVGDLVSVESNTGSGAVVRVDSVTTGNIRSIFVASGGSGYRSNDAIFITDTTGTGATANVLTVKEDGSVHPNSYNIVISLISSEANTNISNSIYTTLNGANANVTLANALSTFVFSNTGPVFTTQVLTSGNNYSTTPQFTTQANTRVAALGILGSMKIVDGGSNYAIGDTIEFINVPGGYGFGAAANVTNVDAQAANAINEVRFVQVPGQIVGGSGYDQNFLPRANVISGTGNGANIIVTSVLGFGAQYTAISSTLGQILRLSIVSRGSGYETPPVLNFTGIGDGTAQAVSTIVTGAFSYPGRWLNDDGHISSYNFLQDRDYYQNFSYVVKTKESIEKYRKALKDLVHPAGMKLFGEYLSVDDDSPVAGSMRFRGSNTSSAIFGSSTNEGRTNIITKGISQRGLVLNLDAGVSSSYPGTGTSWINLSGSSNGTLVNGVSYSASTNYGTFTFDGVNDGCNLSPYVLSIKNNFTISIWCLPEATHGIDAQANNTITGTSGQRYIIGANLVQAPDAGAGISIGTNGVSVYEHSQSYMPPLLVHATTLTTFTNVVITYVNKQPQLYLNGTFIKSGLTSPRANVFLYGNTIGYGPAYGYYQGKLSIVQYYNRALPAEEIQYNFDVLRTRFGI